jgi:hypothetical protein
VSQEDWRLARDEQWDPPPVDVSAVGRPGRRLSWMDPWILWRSHNDTVAKLITDPTEELRALWVDQQRRALGASGTGASGDEFVIDRPDLPEFSMLLMGDTGEGDGSQYAAVPGMLSAGENTDFAMIASDIVYPDGDVNDYVEKFFIPYRDYPQPIYAVPGNHDWLDGLAGFMRHFCGATPPPALERTVADTLGIGTVATRLWRPPRHVRPRTLERAQQLRGEAQAKGPPQPNMYFCIDTPRVRLVCIDSGILGRLDWEQGQWLREVSADPRPKVLVCGKPIYGDAHLSPRRIMQPGAVEGGPLARAGRRPGGSDGSVLSVASDPAHRYRLVVSGDIHNYQRYNVRLADGHLLPFIVSGGGGAFMTATHEIPRVDLPGVTEEDFFCHPSRGDSLRAYSIVYQWLRTGQGRRRNLAGRRLLPRRAVRGIPADEAAVIVAREHGLDLPDELRGVEPSERSRRLARRIFRIGAIGGPLTVSELLDWDCPPLFKSCLRLTVGDQGLRVECFAITGLENGARPPVVDELAIPLD